MAGGGEIASLLGRFDHRRGAEASAGERFGQSLRAVEAGAQGVIHVAHSTHLLALGKTRVLTDPWFYDPAFGALSHEVAPAVRPSAIGPLDAILVSHDHADHADLRAMDEMDEMDEMDKRAAVIVPTNDLAVKVRARGFGDVTVLAPWVERTVGAVTFTGVPAVHDVYEIGYVARAPDLCVYFAGDTGVHPDLPAIAERFRLDVAILPVDGTRLRGGNVHSMTPEEAAAAARVLGAKVVIPSHAEAYFSDPFAGTVLAATVSGASRRFAEVIARAAPAVGCRVPLAGELVRV